MDQKLKQQIYKHFQKSGNKTKTGEHFNVSARTVGRIVDSYTEAYTTQPAVKKAVVKGKKAPVVKTTEAPVIRTEEVEQVDSKEYRYFVVVDKKLINITRVTTDGSEAPTSAIAHVGTPQFVNAVAKFEAGDNEGAFLAVSKKHSIEAQTFGKVTVYPEEGRLEYNDGTSKFSFVKSLAARVIKKIENDESVEGLLKFANFLADNPSKRAVGELYDFLVAGDIEITDEGMVRCFKKVRNNYKDVHSGTFDNSIGAEPSIPRHLVDDDSEVTCSHGLHVCSKAYLGHFGGERVMQVDVNPADFVSIPKDYYSINGSEVKAKARVSRYKVVAEITGKV